MGEMIVDLFCGAGGFSEGVRLATGRVGCSHRRMLEPGSKKRDRKAWPEQQRLTAAEREYARVLRAVKTGLNAWGAA